jgi:Transmembrane domain of unknown function (DUF3566)
VNDTTSNPDDGDGAAVATGEHAPASVETNGSGESHATTVGANGSGGNGSGAPKPSPRPSGDPDRVDTPADGAEPVVEEPPQVPHPAAAEAPTETVRLPGPAPADDDVTRPVDRHNLQKPAVPAQAGPPRGPVPATANGPVPGPSAAAPPPWQRVPGRDPQQMDRSRPAGGLLDDEGPTAFLEAPSQPSSGTAGSGQQSGSWSGVRAVRGRQPRQAALQLKRLDPWSVLKLALVLAVVLFFIWLVAVGVLYGVLDGMGVWDRLNGTYADLVSGEAPTGSPLISAGRVFGLAAVVGAVNSLLFAVAITVGAFVYNVSADLVGGIEVTLSERD